MASSTLGQLVRNAVAIEESAASFYADLAEGTQDLVARAFLADMAEQEVQHARQIEDLGALLAGGRLPQRPDFEVENVECAPAWRYAEHLTLAQALEVAAEAEVQAYLFYDALADRLQGTAQAFFLKLAATEKEHLARLKEFRRTLT